MEILLRHGWFLFFSFWFFSSLPFSLLPFLAPVAFLVPTVGERHFHALLFAALGDVLDVRQIVPVHIPRLGLVVDGEEPVLVACGGFVVHPHTGRVVGL